MDINDLIKGFQGIDKKEVKKAFNKAVEAARGEANDFSTFIIVTDKQTAICGTGAELLSLIVSVISDLAEKGLPKSEMMKCVELAYLSDDELEEKAKESIKERKDTLKKLKEIMKILGEGENE